VPRSRGTGLGANRPPIRTQVSAGGVAFRATEDGWEVALVLVGPEAEPRWQLPKGLVEPGETPESAAIREVREEAGVETELVASLERVEYWYVGTEPGGGRVRYHKFVHFFLLRYLAGDVEDHDREVREARWAPLAEAPGMLAFASERRVMERAAKLLEAM
jgi:8-oxo-dGTP diphosphatase